MILSDILRMALSTHRSQHGPLWYSYCNRTAESNRRREGPYRKSKRERNSSLLWIGCQDHLHHHQRKSKKIQLGLHRLSLWGRTDLWGLKKEKPKHLTLNDLSRWERWILFPENLNVSPRRTKANFDKSTEIPATASGHLWSRATTVNISQVTVNCFPLVGRSWHLTGNSFIVRCPVTIN